jgi:hypothetical protein
MGYLEKIEDAGKKRDILASSDPDPEPEEEKGTGTDAEGAEIFEDFDKEKDKVGEWWLQKGVEEAVEEEPEAEGEEWEEEKEAEKEEDKDDLIYSLREEEEEEEMDMALKTAMDEMGDTSAEELLELGRTALRETRELRGKGE